MFETSLRKRQSLTQIQTSRRFSDHRVVFETEFHTRRSKCLRLISRLIVCLDGVKRLSFVKAPEG